MIHGYGPSNAKIMIVGDFPTTDDKVKNKAFAGYQEFYMEELFKDAGGSFKQIYKTLLCKDPSVKETPKGWRKSHLEYMDQAVKKDGPNYRQILLNEVESVRPNVILVTGDAPLELLTGEKGVRKLKGSLLNPSEISGVNHGTKIMPILHPRDMRQEYNIRFYSLPYIQRALKYQHSPTPYKEDFIIWVCRSYESLNTYFQRNQSPEFVVCDIETHHGFITAIGFCTDGREGVSIPMLEKNQGNVEKTLIWDLIAKYMASGLPFVNQNISFDMQKLEKFGFLIKNVIGDTMLMGRTLYPELPGNLGFYNSIYTEMPYFKDEAKNYDPRIGEDRLYKYNAKDCISTWRIWKKEVAEAKELGVWDFYHKVPQKCFYMYKKMEERGLRLDQQAQTSLREKYEEMFNVTGSSLQAIVGHPLNVNSPKQVAKLLYEELELPEQKQRRPNGTVSLKTDEDTIEYLALNHVKSDEIRSVLYGIITGRKITKILSFVNSVPHLDGRVRTSYNLVGTDSGRTSTSLTLDSWYFRDKEGKVDWEKLGLSLQQFPKHGYELPDRRFIGDDLRTMFVPSPGYVFLAWDLKQAEAVVVGNIAEDQELLDKINNSDVHRWTASLVLSKPEDVVTKIERDIQGKRTRHGGHYDMGGRKLGEIAKIPIREASKALKRFHEANPKIRSVFQGGVAQAIRRGGNLISPHGRRHDFMDRVNSSLFRKAYSFIPQAVVADHNKLCMLKVKHECPYVEYLGEFHDGTLCEVPEDKVPEVKHEATKIIEAEIPFTVGTFKRPPVIIRSEFSIGKNNWHEMEEL